MHNVLQYLCWHQLFAHKVGQKIKVGP